MSSAEDEQRALVEGMRALRERARSSSPERPRLPDDAPVASASTRLSKLSPEEPESAPSSPDREHLNASWDVATALCEPAGGAWGRLLAPVRQPLQRLVRFALGPVIDRQVQWNASQVRFDNELVTYVDRRLDRLARHYDTILGLHGKRMEEIDERHSILQQELIRHVHDLVERIEFVFESAETNHLYVEGMLRETREELLGIVERLEALGPAGRDEG